MLDFDSDRPTVQPKDAATVVVVRQAASGVELFCVQRHARSGFLGGAIVFPGGKVDPADAHEQWRELSTGLGDRVRQLADSEARARSFAIAALRELLEEAALLPVTGAALDAEAALSLREQLARESSFADLLRHHDLRVDTARLEALGRWVTPAAESRRYDTRFYVLPLPQGQSGAHDQHETTSSFWATPARVLERWERGEIFLAPPTVRSVEIFRAAGSVDEALAIARGQSLDPVCPYFVMDGDRAVLALPGDPLFPEPGEPPADPLAPTRFEMDGGRFVGRRVTASGG